MSAVIQCQYDFFETRDQSESRAMKEHIEKLEISLGKVRRGTYARLGEHSKRLMELESKYEIIEQNLCQN